MFVGRVLGWIILVLGLVVLGRDLIGWLDTHRLEPIALGQLWSDFDRGSLDFIEASIRRFTMPALWDPVITTLLRWWAAPLFIVAGIVLLMACRRREERASRRRRR
jgi:hypothetical protein